MSTIDNERRKSRLTPRDAQKGGQGAISEKDPTLELDESGGSRRDVKIPQGSLPSSSLSDQHIAILCDIGDGHAVTGKYKRILDELVADGFLQPANDEAVGYKLTGKAQNLLAQRGAGLNEA
jgi:hypothetical protein